MRVGQSNAGISEFQVRCAKHLFNAFKFLSAECCFLVFSHQPRRKLGTRVGHRGNGCVCGVRLI